MWCAWYHLCLQCAKFMAENSWHHVIIIIHVNWKFMKWSWYHLSTLDKVMFWNVICMNLLIHSNIWMYIASCFFKLTSICIISSYCKSIEIVHWCGCRTQKKHDTQHVYDTVQIAISAPVVGGYILVWNAINTCMCTKTNGETHLMNNIRQECRNRYE